MEFEVDVDSQNSEKNSRLRDVFKIYLIALVVFVITCIVGAYTTSWIPLLVYFGIGIYLTKVYLPQLISFHPVYATIDNLISVKLRAILFWPLSYFFLLMKLGFLHVMR